MFDLSWQTLICLVVAGAAGLLVGFFLALGLTRGGLVGPDPDSPYPTTIDLTDPRSARFPLVGVIRDSVWLEIPQRPDLKVMLSGEVALELITDLVFTLREIDRAKYGNVALVNETPRDPWLFAPDAPENRAPDG